MKNDRFVHTIWCDDIRQEVGNKPSFMGVYIGSIVLPKLPTVLPRLCLWITINASLKKPCQTIAVRVERDDGFLIAEIPETSCPLNGGPSRAGMTRQVSMLAMTLGGIEIPASCKSLQVRVRTEEEELEGSRLWVDVNPGFIAQVVPDSHAQNAEQNQSPIERIEPPSIDPTSVSVQPARKRAAAKKKSVGAN